MTDPVVPPLPLFYRAPQPLAATVHDDVQLTGGDFAFAADANAVPVTIIEFAQVMRFYPIVFADGGDFPVAVLGLSQGNRFVTDGAWTRRHYVPAYVRRYPFVFAEAGENGFALALDVASDRVARGGEPGAALFVDGQPTPLTEGAMAFCQEFHQANLQTQLFVEALQCQGLLVAQQADACLPSGEPRRLAGFRVVDREKFEALPEAVILDWHRLGWLALVQFHLTSLDRFADLLALEGAGGTEPTGAGNAPAETAAELAAV